MQVFLNDMGDLMELKPIFSMPQGWHRCISSSNKTGTSATLELEFSGLPAAESSASTAVMLMPAEVWFATAPTLER